MTSEEAHETATGLLICRLLLLLLLRLSTAVEETTHELSSNTAKAAGAATRL